MALQAFKEIKEKTEQNILYNCYYTSIIENEWEEVARKVYIQLLITCNIYRIYIYIPHTYV